MYCLLLSYRITRFRLGFNVSWAENVRIEYYRWLIHVFLEISQLPTPPGVCAVRSKKCDKKFLKSSLQFWSDDFISETSLHGPPRKKCQKITCYTSVIWKFYAKIEFQNEFFFKSKIRSRKHTKQSLKAFFWIILRP